MTPPIAVVTGGTGLDPDGPLLTGAPPDARTIVITGSAAPASAREKLARHAEVVTGAAEHATAREIVTALTSRGHGAILAEGGPGLLAVLAAGGVLDELCLTISPVLAGGTAGRILAGRPPLPDSPDHLALAHVLTSDGFLFCRYVRAR
jgi:riboflavin biosynthesis pyrimidine reductase